MRRAMSETLMTAGSALVIVITLVAFDDRVREQVSLLVASRPAVSFASLGDRVQGVMAVLVTSAHQQSLAHAPLLIFSLAGIVLVLFMLRT
jgi:hypothetical protein